ncbi:MAG TPA: chemotaxis response regulator protein-glutamate methylesterase [Opitutaceae bacterium]|nr:chemotaxis response regulator protein-glutamate methylesterase [Opitutaceae bacterium]
MPSFSRKKVRVLVVDDSSIVRKLVTEALSSDPGIEVVGTAVDPYMARDKIKELQPDVLTLDIEMPRMDGLTFLQLIMEHRPMPVIIMSSHTPRSSRTALEALRMGAVDVLSKPDGPYSFGDLGPQLIEMVKAAAGAKLRLPGMESADDAGPADATPAAKGPPLTISVTDQRAIILLGASTGGTEALSDVLRQLPCNLPPIVMVQHIPPHFSQAFAERLNKLCRIEVREAKDGDWLRPGLALLAPGNFHMVLHRVGERYRVRVTDGPMVWHQRPAVDPLFQSAADCAGSHAIAGVLTGMGKDGAEGLLRLRKEGATTFAQDEATSVVYGMPRVAWENGGAQRQLPLEKIADFLIRASISLPAPTPPPAPATSSTPDSA